MTQPAPTPPTSDAEILRLDAWRDPDGVLQRAIRREPWPRGWHDLAAVNNSDKRDAIRVYARLGMHPIALYGVRGDGSCTCGRSDCAAIGKHPVGAGWQRAPLDLRALDEHLLEHPDANIGLRTGVQPDGSSLVVLDVDGALSLLDPVAAEHGPIPATLTAKTARGWHLFFKVAPDIVLRNRVRLAPGVDVRAAGGQVVAAPSRHVSGARYRWHDVRAPEVLT